MRSAAAMPRRSARLAAQAAAAAACPLLQLSDDVLEVVGHQISDALRPAVAGALAACNHNLWRVMRTPLAKLQPLHAAARALAAKVGSSCAALRDAAMLNWAYKGLDAADMATLAMLFSTGALARVERLWLGINRFGPAGGSALFDGLGCSDAPRLTYLSSHYNGLGSEGALALAGALSRGALPKLDTLIVAGNEMGDEALVALALRLRRRPALRTLDLGDNSISDAGLSALLDNLGSKELKQLERLFLDATQITDAGCATIAAALDLNALPRLKLTSLDGMLDNNSVSIVAKVALRVALQANEARRSASIA